MAWRSRSRPSMAQSSSARFRRVPATPAPPAASPPPLAPNTRTASCRAVTASVVRPSSNSTRPRDVCNDPTSPRSSYPPTPEAVATAVEPPAPPPRNGECPMLVPPAPIRRHSSNSRRDSGRRPKRRNAWPRFARVATQAAGSQWRDAASVKACRNNSTAAERLFW